MGELIKTIKLLDTDSDYLEFLYTDKNSYQEILSYILLKRDQYEYSKENYDHFMNEFREANIKYNQMFRYMIKEYAPEYFGDENYTVQFDFEEQVMKVYKAV